MANIGAIIGVVVALGIIALLVWYLGTLKESWKHGKGKIVYQCVTVSPDPNEPTANTGSCQIVAAPGKTSYSTHPSIAECKTKCGIYYACRPIFVGEGICEIVGDNTNGSWAPNFSTCDTVCNKFDPAPLSGSIASGRYQIQSTQGKTNEETAPAYLVSRYDPDTNMVYAWIDVNATQETADIFEFNLSSGTIKSNKRIQPNNPPGNKYPYPDQDLYLSIQVDTTTNPPTRIAIILEPLGNSQYTRQWFLSTDNVAGGRIARAWTEGAPNDYVCVQNAYPNTDPQQQSAPYCRTLGDVWGFKFIPRP